jgi:hypothetical protein
MNYPNILKGTLILVSTFLFINTTSCQTKSKTQKSAKTKTPICSVKIDFSSAGAGIDHATMEELKKMIEAKKIKYTESSKGREGETQWCLTLTNLKAADKVNFIEQLKKRASTGQYVSVSSN